MKKVPTLQEVLDSKMKELAKERDTLKTIFMQHKENDMRGILKHFELEQETLKKYGCSGTGEMIGYICDLGFLIDKIHNEIFYLSRR